MADKKQKTKPKPNDRDKEFYELRVQGMTNQQIADKYKVKRATVAVRVSYYKRFYNLAAPPAKSWSSVKNPIAKALITEEQRREEAIKQATRRADGVLVCPPRYCDGYGF